MWAIGKKKPKRLPHKAMRRSSNLIAFVCWVMKEENSFFFVYVCVRERICENSDALGMWKMKELKRNKQGKQERNRKIKKTKVIG